MVPKETLGKRGKRRIIKDTIIGWIDEQHLAPGDQILAQSELAACLNTTEVTIYRALQELAAEGVLHRISGKGTFVGPLPGEKPQAKTLALLMPGEGLDQPERNPHYWPYVQHLMAAFMRAAGTRWDLTVRAFHTDVNPEAEARQLAHCDAVFFHFSDRPVKLIQYLVRRKIVPVVALGMPKPELPCLTIDHNATVGVGKAVQYLADRGYRKLAFIGSREWWGDQSLAGFRLGLQDCGLPFDPALVVRVGEYELDGVQGGNLLLEQGQPYDAVFVDSDMHGLGVIDSLRKAGVRVPDDIGVIGYDGLDRANRQPPFLTTVAIPYERMIDAALNLVERLHGKPTPVQHLDFTGDVLEGKTVREKVPAAANPS